MKVKCIKEKTWKYNGRMFFLEKGKVYDALSYHATSEFSGEYLVCFPDSSEGFGNLSCPFDRDLFEEVPEVPISMEDYKVIKDFVTQAKRRMDDILAGQYSTHRESMLYQVQHDLHAACKALGIKE